MEKFYVKKQDKKRWSEQLSEIYLVLSDREWHSREEIVARTGALEPSSRISELRKKGYKIQAAEDKIIYLKKALVKVYEYKKHNA